MGTIIEAAATALPGRVFGRGARHLIDAAARSCLERACHEADELDLLVNTGLYKDHHLAEPALAAIVQEDVGANADEPPRIGHHGTVSFDVQDGGCGVITALSVVDAFVGHGAARLGMIVAGDVDPSPRTTRGFHFAPAGGALLVANTDDDTGFVRFSTRTFPEHAGMFEGHVRWDPGAGFAHRGRNVLEIFEAPAFAATCVDLAARVARELLVDTSVAIGEIDLLVASQYPPRFAIDLARTLGLAEACLPVVAPELVGSHTAGPIAALEAAIRSRRFSHAHRVLFVACGAGLTIATALYRA